MRAFRFEELLTILVSIVIPTYNRGPRIEATLDSVLRQTLAPSQMEILVVDDGSQDGTPDWILARYGAQNRVRVVQQPNQGVANARNRGLQEARGEFIAFLDHDDIWRPDKLEKQIVALKNRPAVGVVYALWQEIDAEGAPLIEHDIHAREVMENQPQGRVFNVLMRRNFIVSMSVPLMRTELLRQIGGFDGETAPCDDWDLWLRLSREWEFALVPEVLVYYRRHAEQQSSDDMKMWRAAQRALIKHWKAILFQPKSLWLVVSYKYFLGTVEPFYHRARAAVCEGNWPEARRQIVRCSLRHPATLLIPQWLYIAKRLVKRDARPF